MKKIKNQRLKKVLRPQLGYFVIFASLLISLGCGGNESILRSGKETPVPVNTASKTAYEQDLEAMKTAGFKYLFVLRRRDGEKLDTEDRGVIKLHTSQVNRRVAADDDRAFLVGSNYELAAKSILALKDRFAFEDLSPPPTAANTDLGGYANK